MDRRRRARLRYGLLVGLAAAAMALFLDALGLLDRWEYATWSWRARAWAAPGPHTRRIAVIVVDQASLDWASEEKGLAWPWPRQVYAPILRFCRRAGARAVGLDILFTEPSAYGVSDDEMLRDALTDGPPSVVAFMLSHNTQSLAPLPDGVREKLALLSVRDGTRKLPAASYRHAILPIPEVIAGATRLANVAVDPDADNAVRRAPVLSRLREHLVGSLPVALYRLGQRSSRLSVLADALSLKGARIPLDVHGCTIIRYRGGAGTYTRYRAADIIESELRLREGRDPLVAPEELADTYVLLGFTAPGLCDLRATPLGAKVPGVEVHAALLDNLLAGDAMRDAPRWLAVAMVILLAAAGGAGIAAGKRAWHSVVAFAVMLPLPMAAGFAAYPAGVWLPVMPAQVAVVLALAGAMAVNYLTEEKEKRFIRTAFGHYLSGNVMEQVLGDPARLRLGGERRELSILFSDLQGFTGISESLTPENLTALLNDYLSEMTDILFDEDGTLDKYEGDAIIAFWGAPLDQADHAKRAVRAALRCQRRLAELRPGYTQQYGKDLFMRIGLHSGDVVVGNMGSRRRFDYTVLGDTANLAARLEGANKACNRSHQNGQAISEGAGS